jgi:hypothetical protein
MIETALVYIRKADETKAFVGCGALVEGPYIATCRHVWRDADGEANGGVEIVFPRSLKRAILSLSARASQMPATPKNRLLIWYFLAPKAYRPACFP